MDYRPLGRTGVSVSQLCLGAMMFGAWGNPDHDDAVRIVHKALDAGINVIDTADGYSGGESEEILGKALAGGRRASVVLAVKFGPPFDKDPNHRGASRRWITEGVEGSLRRLQTDWIDLYQVGVPAPRTPTSTRPSAPCRTSCMPARSAPSVRRRSPPPRSLRLNGSPIVAATHGSAPNSPPTRGCTPKPPEILSPKSRSSTHVPETPEGRFPHGRQSDRVSRTHLDALRGADSPVPPPCRQTLVSRHPPGADSCPGIGAWGLEPQLAPCTVYAFRINSEYGIDY